MVTLCAAPGGGKYFVHEIKRLLGGRRGFM